MKKPIGQWSLGTGGGGGKGVDAVYFSLMKSQKGCVGTELSYNNISKSGQIGTNRKLPKTKLSFYLCLMLHTGHTPLALTKYSNNDNNFEPTLRYSSRTNWFNPKKGIK